MQNQKKIISELGLKTFGGKGWMRSQELVCPSCGKWDKFGIRLTEKGGIVHCFYDGYKTSLYNFLKTIGKQKILGKFEYEVDDTFEALDENPFDIELDEKVTNNVVKKPIGYKAFKTESPYLKSRNFNSHHYDIFKPGSSSFHPKLDKNYIIFLLYQNKELIGWLARSQHSKEWHKKNLEAHKAGESELKLRYYNHSKVEFSNILGGFDEVTPNTTTIILVEGLFDKVNVDTQLNLNESDEIKCLVTFGDNITEPQVNLLRGFKNIQNIFLMYDFNTIDESKIAGLNLRCFKSVKVCLIKEEADPGELDVIKIIELLENSTNYFDFFLNKVAFPKFH